MNSNKHQTAVTALLSSILTVVVLVAGLLLLNNGVIAAPLQQDRQQNETPSYVSVSAMAFTPVDTGAAYTKDPQRQLLLLTNRDFTNNRNHFVAPLSLPDGSVIRGMSIYGEDFDGNGSVIVRLKRCSLGQAACATLTENASTVAYNIGQFNVAQLEMLNETVDNNQSSYFLELELTAMANSGLRSVQVELNGAGSGGGNNYTPPPLNTLETWSLSGGTYTVSLPNTRWAQVQVCANNFSLPSRDQFPIVRYDGNSVVLEPNQCQTVSGTQLAIIRRATAGDSSGTYKYLMVR